MKSPAEYREIHPSFELTRTIECYWTLEVHRPFTQRVVPDGCLDLVFFWRERRLQSVQVVGTMTRPQLIPLAADQLVTGIRFHPGAIRTVLDAPVPALVDGETTLARLHSPVARAADAIFRHYGETGRGALATFDNCLAGFEALLREGRTVVVGDGSAPPLLSERQRRRVCLQETGLSPKRLARILRFRRVWQALQTAAPPAIADLAVSCGYSDQAHLTREFREFAGISPGRCFRSR